MVEIVQAVFCDGTLYDKSMWYTVALIPNEYGKDFGGIDLMEILWKTITGILNLRLKSEIAFHDALHGFWTGRRTGTTYLNTKLLQQLIAIMEAFINDILMGTQKAYNALNRDRCLNILVGYGMGPRSIRILWKYWDRLTMVAKVGGYYAPPP